MGAYSLLKVPSMRTAPLATTTSALVDIQLHTAAGSYADKRIRSTLHQFLHGNGGGGTADACGGHADLYAVQITGVKFTYPGCRHQLRVIKIGRNLGASLRISRKDHITSYLAPSPT